MTAHEVIRFRVYQTCGGRSVAHLAWTNGAVPNSGRDHRRERALFFYIVCNSLSISDFKSTDAKAWRRTNLWLTLQLEGDSGSRSSRMISDHSNKSRRIHRSPHDNAVYADISRNTRHISRPTIPSRTHDSTVRHNQTNRTCL